MITPLICPCPECRTTRCYLLGELLLALGACLALLLCSCSTVTPPLNEQAVPTVDTSTPPQYPINSSGILGESPDRRWIYITPALVSRYPMATPFVDASGNHVYQIPSDAYAAWYTAKINAQKAPLERTK